MDAIFIYFKKSKTSEPHRLLLNPPGKIELKNDKMFIYQISVFTIHTKI